MLKIKLKYKFQIDTDYIGEMYVSSSDILILATKQNNWYIMLKGCSEIFYITKLGAEIVMRSKNSEWFKEGTYEG